MMNKKGTVIDALVILVVIGLTLGITSLVVFKYYNDFYDQTYPIFNESATAAKSLDIAKGSETMFDYIFLATIVGLIIVGYVFAFLTRQSSIFLFLNILIALGLIVISVAAANTYDTIENDPNLAATAANFPIQSYIFGHLPFLMTLVIAGMFVVMFVFSSGGADGT